jgi:RNA polymerase sigma factor (sigma-70 family)
LFYKQTEPDQLSRAQMDMARKAFRGKLVRLRFSPQFIVNNADELLAIAHTEFVRAVQNGTEIEDPVAWTIHCAWRRTQNLLQSESNRPRTVSSEKVAELIDEGVVAPEDRALEAERARKIREAVAKLDPDQRKVIALTFFEDMSVREAARHLGCSAGSVQHRRETALRTLRRFLPVRSGDELAIDVGMACWLSLAASQTGFHLPAGFEAVLDRAGHEASGIWGRVQDMARRLTVGGGGETATAVASGGAGRAIGVCATSAAIVCLAGAGSGLVGPGIAGLGGGHPEPPAPQPKVRHHSERPPTSSESQASTVTPPTVTEQRTEVAEAPAAATSTSTSASRTRKAEPKASEPTPSPTPAQANASVRHEEATQVEEEVSGIARAGQESSSAAPPVAAASDKTTEAPTVVHTGSGGGSQAAGASAEEEFNFEK